MTSTAIFGLACFGIMIALIILGVPIAISMFVISVVGFYITGGISMLGTQLSNGIFSLSAYAMAICLVLLCELGNITPPVGNSVFTTAIITGENPMKIFKGVTPFFIAELAACVLFGMVPIIITFIPNLLGM